MILDKNMGGYGSGRRYHYSTRSYTDDYLDLDIRIMNKRGWLDKTTCQNLTWKRNNQEIGSIKLLVETRVQFPNEKIGMRLNYKARTNGGDWQEQDYTVELEATKCNFGGLRYWFKCPKCNKRVCVLYAGTIFKCRTCHGLVHKSRNESTLDQAIRRLHKEKDKLYANDDISLYDSVKWLYKPKWMRYKTFEREKAKLIELENKTNKLILYMFE